MSSKLDQSLDDVIKSNPGRRGGRGGARSNGGGQGRRSSNGSAPPSDAGHPLSRSEESSNGSGPVRRERRSGGAGGRQGGTPYQRPDSYRQPRNFDDDAEWKHDMHQQEQAAQARLNADKIYVANLDADVNEDDVKEIFGKVGKISKVVINFNQQGKSLGTAEVTFARKGDAEKAVTEYDGAEVDSRPMQVKLVGTMVQPRVVKKRTPPPQQYQPQQQQYQQRPRQQQGGNFQQRPRQSRGGGGGGRTGGRGGRGNTGGGRRNDKGPTPTAESLDAELDNWNNNKSATATTTTAAAAGQPTSAAAAGQPTA